MMARVDLAGAHRAHMQAHAGCIPECGWDSHMASTRPVVVIYRRVPVRTDLGRMAFSPSVLMCHSLVPAGDEEQL